MVKVRSSHLRCSMKKAFLKNFAIFRGKRLCWSLFLINFIKKRLQHRCSPYGVTLKAPVLKNICERLLLNGRHWYSTNDILKFYYWDKMEVSPFSFSRFFIRVLFLDYIFFGGSRTIAPVENCPSTAKLTLRQTITLTGGQFSSGAIVWLSPNPKTNPDPDPSPNPNRGAIFLGGQLSGYHFFW